MRYSGRWMTLVDDRVLEFIHENKHGSPKMMKEEGRIRYSRQYIDKRCKELVSRGLLQHVGNGVYIITEDGERYLEGDLDTGELDDEGVGNGREVSA